MTKPSVVAAILLSSLAAATEAAAFSVLSHQAIIDAAWERVLVPALRAKYTVSADDLRRARAFAYGGALIQDIGYYPLSSRMFGDLTHYVRSGDFVETLLRDASDVTEYAFALGALAHYAADTYGHPGGINRAVPLVYPKLLAKFGPVVTYAQNPAAHLKTEFGFDVLQVARGAYLPDAYHDFIGFEIAKGALDRACRSTYGVPLEDVFGALDLSIGTFRWTVSRLIPEATKVAWELKEDEIVARDPALTREKFLFTLTRSGYEQKYGREYERPGLGHKILAFLFRLIPRIGPFRTLAFEPPTPEAEQLFHDSFSSTVTHYEALVGHVRSRPSLENLNLDTGRPVSAGDYPLVDRTYARLLDRLADKRFENVPEGLRKNVLAFYANLDRPIDTKKSTKHWRKLQQQLRALRTSGSDGSGGNRRLKTAITVAPERFAPHVLHSER